MLLCASSGLLNIMYAESLFFLVTLPLGFLLRLSEASNKWHLPCVVCAVCQMAVITVGGGTCASLCLSLSLSFFVMPSAFDQSLPPPPHPSTSREGLARLSLRISGCRGKKWEVMTGRCLILCHLLANWPRPGLVLIAASAAHSLPPLPKVSLSLFL